MESKFQLSFAVEKIFFPKKNANREREKIKFKIAKMIEKFSKRLPVRQGDFSFEHIPFEMQKFYRYHRSYTK